jgi:hypothetical protein
MAAWDFWNWKFGLVSTSGACEKKSSLSNEQSVLHFAHICRRRDNFFLMQADPATFGAAVFRNADRYASNGTARAHTCPHAPNRNTG